MRELLTVLREDWAVHQRAWTSPGFQALAVHRFGCFARTRRSLHRMLLAALHSLLYVALRNLYGIELPVSTQVGRRVHIWHHAGLTVHGSAIIGDDCELRQNVTIGIDGAKDRSTGRIAPTLERGVSVGAGAVIAGGVTIGAGARIGANALVMMDVPPGATAFTQPARVMRLPGAKPTATIDEG